MIKYYKLFDLLNRRGMKKTDLLKIISSPTLAKISKGQNINTDVIDKICIYLNCQPNDIMEVVIDEISNHGEKLIVKSKLPESDEYRIGENGLPEPAYVEDDIEELNITVRREVDDKGELIKYIEEVSQDAKK